jgi:L-glutamine-phosphate cytidylyltransferase
MDVIILAAGLGTRLKKRTTATPKALVALQNKPLLGFALDAFLARSWIDRAIVVTGFERKQVQDYLSTRSDPKPVLEIWNVDYKKGNFYSLACGLREVGEEFLVTNADHIFPTDLLDHVYETSNQVTAVCDFDRNLQDDCMKVELSEGSNRRMRRIHKKLTTYQCGYIGMTVVRKNGLGAYKQAVERVQSRREDSAYAEMVVQELADGNVSSAPCVADASGFGWLEVDTEEDYAHATEVLKNPLFLKSGKSRSPT